MTHAVQVRNLRKSYGKNEALRGVDLDVGQGEVFALLGANGAGKTTALECIEGLRRYDGGSVSVRGRTGIQLQSASLPAHIRGKEAIRLFAKWNRTSPDRAMLAALGAEVLADKQYREMSTGQKRRLHLALALTGNPDILFLDEPTAGLDTEGRLSLHACIRALKGRGKTVLLSSHDMAEVESLCDGIAILLDGRIAFAGTVGELADRLGTRYSVRIKTNLGVEEFEVEDIERELPAVLRSCREKNAAIKDIQVDRGSLERHFVRITKGE